MMHYQSITEFLVTAVAILFTITVHELAHGVVAYWNGDDTAKRMGRLTLNPLAHLDPLGTLCLFLAGFGWAKPVPINPSRFTNRNRGLFTVSLAGVSVNMISAFLALLILRWFPLENAYWISFFLMKIAVFGIAFAVFNLLPIPPLDGFKVLCSFLPQSVAEELMGRDQLFSMILIVLLATGLLGNILSPLTQQILRGMMQLVF